MGTVIALLLIAAMTQAHADTDRAHAEIPADARATIARANDDWLAAMKRQDAKTIVEPYADEAVFVMPSGETVKGKPAIEQLMQTRFGKSGRVIGGTLQQDNLVAAGSMIYEWGHADLEIAGGAGKPPSHSAGRYLTVWKRDASGRWRIIRNLSLAD
jgi:uncharacterized protein (TIGR02246 family)